jgi:hypothetical protein
MLTIAEVSGLIAAVVVIGIVKSHNLAKYG